MRLRFDKDRQQTPSVWRLQFTEAYRQHVLNCLAKNLCACTTVPWYASWPLAAESDARYSDSLGRLYTGTNQAWRRQRLVEAQMVMRILWPRVPMVQAYLLLLRECNISPSRAHHYPHVIQKKVIEHPLLLSKYRLTKQNLAWLLLQPVVFLYLLRYKSVHILPASLRLPILDASCWLPNLSFAKYCFLYLQQSSQVLRSEYCDLQSSHKIAIHECVDGLLEPDIKSLLSHIFRKVARARTSGVVTWYKASDKKFSRLTNHFISRCRRNGCVMVVAFL